MLPFTWRGTVTLGARAGDDPERVVDRLISALAGVRATGVQREPGTVVFKGGPLRFASNWNLLASISWGRVEIARGSHGLEAHYQLSFSELVAFVSVSLGLMITLVFLLPGFKNGLEPLAVLAVVMVLVVGFNIGVAIDRFSTFVHRVAFAESPQ